MTSLKLGKRPDETQPFLSREEYLALPRKQSRLDQTSREIVYSLYERYEELKKKNHFFDVMDLVHSVARRIPAFLESDDYHAKKSFLPVDSVFVDEVQDFTQAELYILAKLCSSQNTLFLAGDTVCDAMRCDCCCCCCCYEILLVFVIFEHIVMQRK